MESVERRISLQGILLLLTSFMLAIALSPGMALADTEADGAGQLVATAADAGQSQVQLQADSGALATQENKDISVTVGLPSESNVKRDLAVAMTYNDDFFASDSKTYNNDLAYASVCLASAADNSNEGGSDYALKAKNIKSLLQQIGCKDITTNDGYNYKPMTKANIGVAIGYKDITVNDGKKYRLFVFGVRGGGYEEEWAVNMRVGKEGDATGFQEARDGALGFILPYIKEHTKDVDGEVNVKVWGSGYCRGGTTTNMVFGWLNKWVYERSNGRTYQNLDYTQNYNAEHSVYGADFVADTNYDDAKAKYTTLVSFDPASYIESNVKFTNDDLYAYPVNCPYGSDATDVKNYQGLMTGIHNLINPDDWFPQVIMDWWGFDRYGSFQDHDITGTYKEDGALRARDKAVWDPSNRGGRQDAVVDMAKRLKAVDPDTAYNSTFFQQYYFSKQSVATNLIRKVGGGILNWIKRAFGAREEKLPDIFQISVDEKGEGNVYVSKGVQLEYKQGRYYEEFLKFLLNAAGIPADATAKAQREAYVDKYQDAFVYLMKWVCGQPLEVREKFGKVASDNVSKAFEEIRKNGDIKWGAENLCYKALAPFTSNKLGRFYAYYFSVAWAICDPNATLLKSMIEKDLHYTLNDLKVKHSSAQLNIVENALGPLVYNVFVNEQKIGALNFYHVLTLYKAAGSVAQSHWPEQSLAWFSQCKPADSNEVKKSEVKPQSVENGLATQDDSDEGVSEHYIYTYYPEEPDVLYDEGTRENGDIIGVILPPDDFDSEQYVVEKWDMYDLEDILEGKDNLLESEVTELDEISADDPEFIVLVPDETMLESKHVNLWLNKAMTGYDQDVKLGEFDVFAGGSYGINVTGLPDEDMSESDFKELCEDSDVLYYGDNDNLLERAGISLYGWTTKVENEDDEMFMFQPDDILDYDDLPEGDTVDLYAIWLDPLVYGMTYHANRTDSDEYVFEDAKFASEEGALVVEGFDQGDKGLQNEGMELIGWNTKADGSGAFFATGEAATLEQLGLGTREQYLQDLEQLSELTSDIPINSDAAAQEESNDEAEAFEAQLETKYTTHLYAQWAPSCGATYKVKGNSYKVTSNAASASGSAGTVSLAKAKNAKKVVVPATVTINGKVYEVTAIGSKAFSKSKKAKTVVIGKNVQVINATAFAGCKKLVKVKGGVSVTVIGARAFAGCKKMKTCTATASTKLVKIGKQAFKGCKKFKKMTVKSSKLTKKNVKGSLKGSSVKTVKLKAGSKKLSKKYKKAFAKKNSGKKATVKA